MANQSFDLKRLIKRLVGLVQVGPRGLAQRFLDQGRRRYTGRPVWQYSRITPQLYVGGQHRKRGWKAMGNEGITAVVNMRESHLDDARSGIGGKNYLHLATLDNTAPLIEDLMKGAKFIDEQIVSGGKVYIHCGVGIGRAPTQAAAYLIYSGMTAADALALISAKRPFIYLTPTQRAQLDAFEETVRGLGKSDPPDLETELAAVADGSEAKP